ncbi:hypothetical protein QBC35DRAFT_508128 [Podospora australis]|uniref:Uncharacterized protein n=1 Tax=Podospora australis TaxID=1536484 RepID=A0AAN6WJU4_9PEZI|nr:hypothetical protein QBC35DRAFT_508128 [Podospora australis]
MEFFIITESNPLPPAILRHLALSGALDEISNVPGAVRSYIYWHSRRDKETGKTTKPLLFFIYQTGRYGPQNGFRLCVVHQGYYIAAPTKPEGAITEEDEIDLLEKPIPQGHMEVVTLGEAVGIPDPEPESDSELGPDAI